MKQCIFPDFKNPDIMSVVKTDGDTATVFSVLRDESILTAFLSGKLASDLYPSQKTVFTLPDNAVAYAECLGKLAKNSGNVSLWLNIALGMIDHNDTDTQQRCCFTAFDGAPAEFLSENNTYTTYLVDGYKMHLPKTKDFAVVEGDAVKGAFLRAVLASGGIPFDTGILLPGGTINDVERKNVFGFDIMDAMKDSYATEICAHARAADDVSGVAFRCRMRKFLRNKGVTFSVPRRTSDIFTGLFLAFFGRNASTFQKLAKIVAETKMMLPVSVSGMQLEWHENELLFSGIALKPELGQKERDLMNLFSNAWMDSLAEGNEERSLKLKAILSLFVRHIVLLRSHMHDFPEVFRSILGADSGKSLSGSRLGEVWKEMHCVGSGTGSTAFFTGFIDRMEIRGIDDMKVGLSMPMPGRNFTIGFDLAIPPRELGFSELRRVSSIVNNSEMKNELYFDDFRGR